MGEAGTATPSPSGVWGDNLLGDTATIVPGGYRMFSVEIPNLHYCQYSLGVLHENDVQVFLDEQGSGSAASYSGTITHWGSDERTVSATVVRSTDCDCIVQSGYSDFAGIE